MTHRPIAPAACRPTVYIRPGHDPSHHAPPHAVAAMRAPLVAPYRRAFRAVAAVSHHRASVLWRRAAVAGAFLLLLGALLASVGAPLRAQSGVAVTPYAGWLGTGRWLQGPLGTEVGNAGAPVIGAQLAVPLAGPLRLVGTLGYASGDLRVGVPVLGGLDIGTNRTWLYDGALELGGLSGGAGIAPFVSAGVGGLTHDVRSGPINLRATNVAATGAVGLDLGAGPVGFRVQAKTWYGRFDTREAVGFDVARERQHTWQLTAGVRLGF